MCVVDLPARWGGYMSEAGGSIQLKLPVDNWKKLSMTTGFVRARTHHTLTDEL